MDAHASGPVLVVEDDPQVRDVIEELLRMEGFGVESAVDGAEALMRIRSGFRPAVILLDSMMPRMNGAEFLRAREQDAGLLAIPDGTSSRYRIEGFLRKPFDPERLLEVVQKHTSPPGGFPDS
jgi:CheY-like chemotaxis protein